MTGLNLEAFLHLLRADLGAWLSLGVVALILGLMTWTSWGSRRALRKCLVLSVVVHLGVLLYGSTLPSLMRTAVKAAETEPAKDGIREIRVSPSVEKSEDGKVASADGRAPRRAAEWDRPGEALALADESFRPTRPEPPPLDISRPKDEVAPPLGDSSAAPEVNPPEPPRPERRSEPDAVADSATSPPQVAPSDPADAPKVVMAGAGETDAAATPDTPGDRRLRPDRANASAPRSEFTPSRPEPVSLPRAPVIAPPPATTIAIESRPAPPSVSMSNLTSAPSIEPDSDPILVARSTPAVPGSPDDAVAVPSDSDLRNRIRRPTPATRSVGSPIAGSPSTRPRSPGIGAVDRPGAGSSGGTLAGDTSAASTPELALPDADLRQRTRTNRPASGRSAAGAGASLRTGEGLGPVALANVNPRGPTGLATGRGPVGGRSLTDVPAVYRSRLDPNRSALAQRAGASPASEQAVERALDWLVRHQDSDGRWNGGSAGTLIAGLEAESRESFTVHCPPSDICFGECGYAEADTALTGLALLAYLGAGYTHVDGKYAEPVRHGLRYLLAVQKADGDLRGPSKAVGMYCHCMAALALSEAYALTGDERLRQPVERAVDFLVKAQAVDGLAWRYAPREATGDTSILGWVVLVLRSARAVGLSVPPKAESGALSWLNKVSAGLEGGLARYQPHKPVTSTMTAEAWVCRQLLSVGGPDPASAEAAEYLMTHGPDRDPFNLYYWYYGTLAMYQNGGASWSQWNAQVRDQLVRRQRRNGHSAGSWDPDDDDQYGVRGGRIYSTALATLTLEVYYRYLRFYDEPGPTRNVAPRPEPTTDPTLRRAGTRPPSGRR